MDELAVPAAAVAITTNANADDASAQRGSCGTDGVEVAPMAAVERTTVDKENEGGHAATGKPGAADPKVPFAPTMLVCKPCT